MNLFVVLKSGSVELIIYGFVLYILILFKLKNPNLFKMCDLVVQGSQLDSICSSCSFQRRSRIFVVNAMNAVENKYTKVITTKKSYTVWVLAYFWECTTLQIKITFTK